MDDYVTFPTAEPLAGAHALQYPHARALAEAIARDRDVELISVARIPGKEIDDVECLIVDVLCDGVPSRNTVGIQYRERVALLVTSDASELPAVWALRRDFPALIHQNRVAPNLPANLCLYFEGTRAIMRSWTAPRFLRRIRWWMEKNARGELHPADQAVESLFFESNHQLILPWDYEAQADRAQQCEIAKGDDRPDGGATYFLSLGTRSPSRKPGVLVTVTTNPIVSGAVEYDPATLGTLSDLLRAHGVDLLAELKGPLQRLVNKTGVTRGTTPPYTVILMQIPIAREAGARPERRQRRAFILLTDPLEVGVATGALTYFDGRFYTDVNLVPVDPGEAWRALQVWPMEVLSDLTPEAARRQSGFSEPGPRGVVVGAGALGSALLNLWGRSGWGEWSVIDNDYIRPHNLSRHTAFAQHVGHAKVAVVAGLHEAVLQGASVITPIVGDAIRPGNAQFDAALNAASVVIDASAGLDYPRHASTVDGGPRHASVFLTPEGNASVALVEDRLRTRRLRTLEAQYYRAILGETWGAHHLGEPQTFWSGVSCRDISTVMPYSRVMIAAANLADRLPELLASDDAVIRVWQRDTETGAIDVHTVPVCGGQRFELGDLNVYIDEGLQHHLRQLRAANLPSETGGVLLGYYDLNVHELVLVSAFPAPTDSVSSTTSFERGVAGLKERVEEVGRRTGGVVQYVGEWHSHPRGASAEPSGDDLFQLVHLALGMGDEGLPGVQLIVGEHDIVVSAMEHTT